MVLPVAGGADDDRRQRFTLALARRDHPVPAAHGALLIAVRMRQVAQAMACNTPSSAVALRASASPATGQTHSGPVPACPAAHGASALVAVGPEAEAKGPLDHGSRAVERPVADPCAAAGGADIHPPETLACSACERLVGDRAYEDFPSAIPADCPRSVPGQLHVRPASGTHCGNWLHSGCRSTHWLEQIAGRDIKV